MTREEILNTLLRNVLIQTAAPQTSQEHLLRVIPSKCSLFSPVRKTDLLRIKVVVWYHTSTALQGLIGTTYLFSRGRTRECPSLHSCHSHGYKMKKGGLSSLHPPLVGRPQWWRKDGGRGGGDRERGGEKGQKNLGARLKSWGWGWNPTKERESHCWR